MDVKMLFVEREVKTLTQRLHHERASQLTSRNGSHDASLSFLQKTRPPLPPCPVSPTPSVSTLSSQCCCLPRGPAMNRRIPYGCMLGGSQCLLLGHGIRVAAGGVRTPRCPPLHSAGGLVTPGRGSADHLDPEGEK
ncbi:unnamed protein product [Arctogadus glacialis]